MNEPKNFDYNLIEYLLLALEHSEEEKAAVKDWQTPNFFSEIQPPLDSQYRLVALQVKKIMDEMPGGFFIYRADAEEEIIYANKAMYRIFNCNTREEFQELTKNSFRGLVHPDDLEEVEKSIEEQIANSQYDLDYVEYRIIQKGGKIRWVDDYGHFVRSRHAGNVFYVFVGDATEKKNRQIKEKEEIENQNQQKEQYFRNQIEAYTRKMEVVNQEQLRRLEMIEGLSIDYESIFYVDLDANTIQPYRVSSRVEEQFGKDCPLEKFDRFNRRYIQTWVYPEDWKLMEKATNPEYIREKLADEKTFYVYYRIVCEEKIEHLQLRVVNVGNEEHVSQVVLGYRSVDEEVRNDMEHKSLLEAALTQAKSAITAKNTFLSNMSHDIRTPMNAIIGFASLAKHHMNDKEKLEDYLDKIETSGRHLMKLIHDVLEISRMEAGTISIKHEACSLYDVIHEVEEVILPWAKEKEIHVTFDCSNIRHDEIYGDQQNLSQILLRLAANAVKYTENHGKISIIVSEQAEQEDYAIFQFVVEDNGIGIEESFLPHIYEPFERQKNTTLSGIQGTGLGLTIAKNLIEMMGGTIQASSILGKGSRFLVTLSLSIQHKKKESKADRKYSLFDGSDPKRILLVEDNELNLEIEAALLQEAGFVLDTAEDGSIAVDKVKQSVPGYYDVILMDIQMPVMDGYQAARTIRSLENPHIANIPIIALSANIFDEDRKKSMESGMNFHLAKPIDLPKLLEVIQQTIQPSSI